MPTPKEIISRILADAEVRILAAIEEIKSGGSVAPVVRSELRGAIERSTWRDIHAVLSADGADGSITLDNGTYDELLDYLLIDDNAPPPVPGKRDTRRQHAKRLVDRFITRGMLKRDGDIVSLP